MILLSEPQEQKMFEVRGPVGSLPPWSLRAPLLPVMAWTAYPDALDIEKVDP